MDTALPKKFPVILDRNLAKANCTGNRVCTSCNIVVLGLNIFGYVWTFPLFDLILTLTIRPSHECCLKKTVHTMIYEVSPKVKQNNTFLPFKKNSTIFYEEQFTRITKISNPTLYSCFNILNKKLCKIFPIKPFKIFHNNFQPHVRINRISF